MASTTEAKYITNSASILLNDIGQTTWDWGELLRWLNLSQLEIVNLVPSANAVNLTLKLVHGVKQTIPDDGIALLDIPYNFKGGGTIVSSTINAVPQAVMNKRIPGWTTHSPSSTVKHFVYDRGDPFVFYVYPPQPALSTYVRMIYSAIPALIPDLNAGTLITISDKYVNVLLNLVVSKALSKDSEYGNNAVKQHEHRAMAMQELGLSPQAQAPTTTRASTQPSARKQ
jgi:hypothetical protein